MKRHLRHAHGFTLLAILFSPGLARIAAAAPPPPPPPPVFVGTFTSPSLCSPRGVAPLQNGDVLVGSDCVAQHHMERFNSAGSLIGSWAFPADYQGTPNGVTLDVSGNVLVTDSEGGRVLKFTPGGILLASWATGLVPADIAVNSSGDVFVAALNGHRVQKFTS